jgi:hypothetical protein
MMIDWTFGLLFRPDIVKVGLDSETALLLREMTLSETNDGHSELGGAATNSDVVGIALVSAGSGNN